MPVAKKVTFGLCKLKSCKVRFRKKRCDQLFCCREHKDSYYKRGQFPFEKMRDDIMRLVMLELRPILCELVRVRARLDALEPHNFDPDPAEERGLRNGGTAA